GRHRLLLRVRLMTKSEWLTAPPPGSLVLVTGVADGLGRALSTALTEMGAQIVGIALPGTHAAVTADLTDDNSAHRAVTEAADRLGGLGLVGLIAEGVTHVLRRRGHRRHLHRLRSGGPARKPSEREGLVHQGRSGGRGARGGERAG